MKNPDKNVIKINPIFKRAWERMENTDDHIFLTGNAGTGKSTLLQYFRRKTKKNLAVLAPTGVAALNVQGQTIHSFFGFAPGVSRDRVRRATKEKINIIKNLETIVIDEISMVRADLLDCVDQALRLNRGKPKLAFGGVQMIFIGDLFQLPPIVSREEQFMFEEEYSSPYFFSAFVLGDFDLVYIELKKVYRQRDQKFIELLNRMRNKQISDDDIEVFNSRHDPFFQPDEALDYVHLTTTNKMSDERNRYELNRLEGKEETFKGFLGGKFDKNRVPSPSALKLKIGARVMFVCNDPQKRWMNGTLGTIKSMGRKGLEKQTSIVVRLDNNKEVVTVPYTWKMFEHYSDGESISTEQVGSYTQYPLVLAWAVTIHKSQGKTFDRVLVDVGWGAFAHGQMYVALSRCTTLDGIVLRKPFKIKDIIVDDCVVDFVNAQNR